MKNMEFISPYAPVRKEYLKTGMYIYISDGANEVVTSDMFRILDGTTPCLTSFFKIFQLY